MALYRGMDRVQLDAAYNNRKAVAGYEALAARRRERSEAIRAARRFHGDIRYGRKPRERLDVFAAEAPQSPLVAFIHGGYWQTNNKEPSTFIVEGPLARGVSVALIEYTLAPEVAIDEIVSEVGRAVDWLVLNAREIGADPSRIFVAGHSAGGHLTAMMLCKPIAGAIAISGLYELEPIRLCYLNEKLRLDEASVARYSPVLHVPGKTPPIVVAVGAEELPELVRQSRDYAKVLSAKGLPVECLEFSGHDHFSILEELARPQGVLCNRLAEWSDLAKA